jgi:hypothetical protein
VAPLSSDFAWQQLPAPPANALEAAAADPASAAALAALESVVNNAPPLEGAAGPLLCLLCRDDDRFTSPAGCSLQDDQVMCRQHCSSDGCDRLALTLTASPLRAAVAAHGPDPQQVASAEPPAATRRSQRGTPPRAEQPQLEDALSPPPEPQPQQPQPQLPQPQLQLPQPRRQDAQLHQFLEQQQALQALQQQQLQLQQVTRRARPLLSSPTMICTAGFHHRPSSADRCRYGSRGGSRYD